MGRVVRRAASSWWKCETYVSCRSAKSGELFESDVVSLDIRKARDTKENVG